MEVFIHHIYEYEKGLRNMILHTTKAENRKLAEEKLRRKNIPYVIYEIPMNKINIFFGNESCINVIKEIGKSNLCDYTDEEDFIIGIMLGYDRAKQCDRYLKRKRVKKRRTSYCIKMVLTEIKFADKIAENQEVQYEK